MAASVSEQTSNATKNNIYIDGCAYTAATCPQQKVDSSTLHQNLSRLTVGGKNTVLHLASAVGNLKFVQEILRLNLPGGFVETCNVNGNTALHEAAQNGHFEVVVELLRQHGSLVSMQNKLDQTPLFKACEGGHSKIVEKLLEADKSKLIDKSSDVRTCLHVVVSRGDADLLNSLLGYIDKNLEAERGHLLKEKDKKGNTVLHLAVKRNRVDMVSRLLQSEPELPYSQNQDEETAIWVAVKLGFLPVVQKLVECNPDSIEIASEKGKNILHLAVELSQLKILKFLVEKVDLSQLINQPDEAPPKDITQGHEDLNHRILKFLVERLDLSQLINHPDEAPKDNTQGQDYGNHLAPKDDSQGQEDWNRSGGDTPLHIAARNKNVYMVDLLLQVRGVNKEAVNSAGLTPLDIARENTEYHEPYKIIEKLSAYPSKCRPFLYSVPTASPQKKKTAVKILDDMFAHRRDVELVVATLLATMTFTAVFTVPGGFLTDLNEDDSYGLRVLGMPVLIRYDSFKLFLIFDCLAFFLSLFVVLMWEMSTPLTGRDKMLFIYITNAVVCAAFAFTAFSLIAAVYTVLVHKAKRFAAIVLGSSALIAIAGTGAFFYILAKFTIRRARFHRLCGVPRLLDDNVEKCWLMAEHCGVLNIARTCDESLQGLVSGGSIGRIGDFFGSIGRFFEGIVSCNIGGNREKGVGENRGGDKRACKVPTDV